MNIKAKIKNLFVIKTQIRLKALKFIVIHTTEDTKQRAITWLSHRTNKNSSWHFTIDRNGNIFRHAPIHVQCWHAGRSSYKLKGKTYRGLNKYSVGIELVNLGQLFKDENGTFRSKLGQLCALDEVHKMTNKKNWHKFTKKQIEALEFLLTELVNSHPSIEKIVGHCETTKRKTDPGQLFYTLMIGNKIKNVNVFKNK